MHDSADDDSAETTVEPTVEPTPNNRHMPPEWMSDRIENDTPVRTGVDMLNGCTVRTPLHPRRYTFEEKKQRRYVNTCHVISVVI